MNILKGLGAILAGMILAIILSIGTDFVLESLGIFTPPNEGLHITWMVVTAIIYRNFYMAIGGYVTAALAPNRPMLYVIILGLLGLAANLLGAIVTIPMALAPAWYPIALTVLALPCTWLGGKFKRS